MKNRREKEVTETSSQELFKIKLKPWTAYFEWLQYGRAGNKKLDSTVLTFTSNFYNE